MEQVPPTFQKRKKPRWRRMSPMSYMLLALIGFISIFPFYWMVVVASNGNDEISKETPTLTIGPRLGEILGSVFEANEFFGLAMWNTVLVGTIVSAAQVFFSSVAGFAFAKLNFKGRKFLVVFVVGTMMLPSQLGIIP
ncbi:MAG: hypothetical protein RL197_703, partial [Actinomycetota bacterium]